MSLPAPAGGLVVALTSSDPAASVAASLTVPEGAESAQFTVTTQPVPTDRGVTIVARVGERVVAGVLQLWGPLTMSVPMFFSWSSDPGDFIGGGGIARHTPPSSRFQGWCDGSDVRLQVETPGREFWHLDFGAPRGTSLRAGTYEGAMRSAFRDATRPGLDVGGRGRGCNQISGRFVVHDVDLSGDQVRRFWASFEQRCENHEARLIGEIRVSELPSGPSVRRCLQ